MYLAHIFDESLLHLVFPGDGPQHPAGAAHGHHPVRDVPVHHAARADHRVAADAHAGQHRHRRADPHIVAHRDGVGVLQAPVALPGVQGMARRGKDAVGRDEHIVAEHHLRAVQDDAVVVGIKILADLDVAAVVAPEGRGDAEPLPRAAEQPADQRLLLPGLGGPQLVEGMAQILAARGRCWHRTKGPGPFSPVPSFPFLLLSPCPGGPGTPPFSSRPVPRRLPARRAGGAAPFYLLPVYHFSFPAATGPGRKTKRPAHRPGRSDERRPR